MRTLEQILQEIELAPTVMDLALEQAFCRALMKHQCHAIGEECATLRKILDRLEESHIDAIYEMGPKDEFDDFVKWALQLASEIADPACAGALAGVASTFSARLGR